MPSLRMVARATRARVLPVMLAPVAAAAVLGWQGGGEVDVTGLVFALGAASTFALAANTLTDFFEDASGADRAAREDRASVPTGSGLLIGGAITPAGMLGIAAAFAAAGAGCVAGVAVERGWVPVALFVGAFLLAAGYAVPPVAYGMRGRGLGEVGTFAAYGFLPSLAAYQAQTGRIEGRAAWASLVPGLFAVVLTHADLLRNRSDRVIGKRTLPSVLGAKGALVVTGALIAAAYAALAAQVAAKLWPPAALAGLAGGPPLAAAWARARADTVAQNCLQLLGATLGAAMIAGVAIVAATAVAAL